MGRPRPKRVPEIPIIGFAQPCLLLVGRMKHHVIVHGSSPVGPIQKKLHKLCEGVLAKCHLLLEASPNIVP